MTEAAWLLANSFTGGIWGEHPDHEVVYWQYAVANDDTRSSYWDCVLNRIEQEEDE